MDGLHDDADVLFLLTTNRPEEIEDALASRRGRVDEVIAIANPDAGCRARLIVLYGAALTFEEGAVPDAVVFSEGASAAFVKEMVRRLAQASLASGRHEAISRRLVATVFGEATESTSRIGRRIVGLSALPARAGRGGAPTLDECCDGLRPGGTRLGTPISARFVLRP